MGRVTVVKNTRPARLQFIVILVSKETRSTHGQKNVNSDDHGGCNDGLSARPPNRFESYATAASCCSIIIVDVLV